MNKNDIKTLIPSYYTEEQKEEIILLLIELANIYLENEKKK